MRAFVDAAGRADAAGIDVVEIHGAHGYLLALVPLARVEHAHDEYGGDLAGRMRLPLEVVRAVRERWPRDKPLFFRASAIDGIERRLVARRHASRSRAN